MKNLMFLAVLGILLCSINQSYGQNKKKRLLGGFREIAEEDRTQENIQNIINLGTDHVATNSNPQLCREALSLKKIERQIFRKAHNYRITLTVQANACPNQATTMKTCTVIVNHGIETNVTTVSRFRCK